ncbi:hypothetical protein NEOLEDRAFT_867244 [Neolentinus lepideus HHB14362 ss-1]|uniref:Uncharacterized protein n=1 Tax=Neolentinus lepideus HHB14362 ss-1 TaxID=1314782 RepID=A0A165P2L6_9AGAM|nr:hypothetical protein NEOLEDRAFT_867244 [Neolentinus lepideus HHB14362 ss-1]
MGRDVSSLPMQDAGGLPMLSLWRHVLTRTINLLCCALRDIGEALGHFPFVKTIAGLTVQVIVIAQNVHGNKEEWLTLGRLAERRLEIIREQLRPYADRPDSIVATSLENAEKSLMAILEQAQLARGKRLAIGILDHETDQKLQSQFRQVLDDELKDLQISVAAETKKKM